MLQYIKARNLHVHQHHLQGEDYQMDITEIHTPLASIKHGIYTATQAFYHKVLPTKDVILSCNCLLGSSTTLNHDKLDIDEHSSLLFQEQTVPYEHLMIPNHNHQGEFLEVAVNPLYIATLFAEEKDYLGELLERDAVQLHFDLNLPVVQVLQQLITNPYQGNLAVHYLHNKIEEFHLLQYQNWRFSQKPKSITLHPKDKEAIHEIKRYITNHYNESFTLSELALQVGINQTKLKQGFKSMFGTTTFKYLHDLRMQKALELIQTNTYTIYEVAELTGYKHSHHFSTAFKKHFGQLPTSIK